jgi:hypothetical protein
VGENVRCKLLVAVLTGVFLVSVFTVAVWADECSRCHGTGEITERTPCPICNGAGVSAPDIVRKGIRPGDASTGGRRAVNIQGDFHNNGNEGVTATVVGTVKTQTETYTNTTTAVFPPNSDTTVTVLVEGVDKQPYYAFFIEISGYGTNPNCPTCGGTGYVNAVITCPNCGGTGLVSGVGGSLSFEGAGGAIIGVVAVGAVVATGVFVVKKRRVTEQSLRRLTSFEFQAWVVKRLQANPASQKDVYLGIDGYTMDGYPMQIRQEDDVGKRAIDSFAAAMARNKARSGTIVAFGFGKDSLEGVMKARLNYRLEIKTVTVKELLGSRDKPLY